MNSRAAVARFEAAVGGQAARRLAMELAEQAAAGADAQLPHGRVEVVLRGGKSALVVRAGEEGGRLPSGEEYGARITPRLPPSLKGAVGEAARSAGESANTFLVRDLSRMTARSGRAGKRVRGRSRT